MPNSLANQPVIDCCYSPTGKAYQDTNGGCSCSPYTPGLTDQQRDIWMLFHRACCRMTVDAALLNRPDVQFMSDHLRITQDVIFNWDGQSMTTKPVPPKAADIVHTIMKRLDELEEQGVGNGDLYEAAEYLDDLWVKLPLVNI